MANKIESLKAEIRTTVGTRSARALRSQGRIPVAVGADKQKGHVDAHIEQHGFMGSRRRHAHLYELEVGAEKTLAVVNHLDWDTFGEVIVHIDFKRVQRDVKTEIEVQLDFIGHPKGGILNHLITHVKVRCLPLDIPDSIEVLVAHLNEGDSVYVKELKAPEGVEILLNPEQRVAVAVSAKELVLDTAAAAGEAAAAATTAAAAAAAAPAIVAPPTKG